MSAGQKPLNTTLYKWMALLHHCTYRTFFARWVLLWMLVENVLLWCKRLSKKSKKKKKWKTTQKTQKATKHTNFPVFSSTEEVPVHTSVSLLFHVHKQKYIHSSHFGTVFFFFCTQKLQKAPKSTIESACGDRGCGKLANPELVTSTKQLSHISLLSIGAWYIVLHVKLRCYHLVSEIKSLYNSLLIYL